MPPAQSPLSIPGAQTLDQIDASSLDTSKVDPKLSQDLLTKIANNIPLSPTEKLAANQLTPAMLARAHLAPISPAPDVEKLNNDSQILGINDSANNYQSVYPKNKAKDTSYKDAGLPPAPAPMITPAPPPVATPVDSVSGASIGPSAAIPKAPIAQPKPIIQPMVANDATPDEGSTDTISSGYRPTSPTAQVAQQIVNSPNAPPSLKGMKGKDIANLIGNVLDVIGVGLSARGGVNRQTMLQMKQQLGLETSARKQQQMGQAEANVAEATAKVAPQLQLAQGTIAAQLAALPTQAKNEMAIYAQQKGIDLSNAKAIADHAQELQIQLTQAYRKMGIMPPGVDPSLTSLFLNAGGEGSRAGAEIASKGQGG
jgi:hypothetical protein